MSPFKRRKSPGASPSPVEEPAEEAAAVFDVADVSQATSETVADHLGSLVGSVIKVVDEESGATELKLQIGDELVPISPEEHADIQAASQAWQKAAQQPELPPDGAGPAA